MFRENRLKRKIAAGEAVYGFWLGLGDPALAEMASAAGYDFVIIDNEHGQQTYAQTLDLMRAARLATPPSWCARRVNTPTRSSA